MRLIHTGTLALHDFMSSDAQPYAILSHRWVGGEVTLQEYQSVSDNSNNERAEEIKSRAGYRKIAAFCRLARADGLEFGWVDTCCIDKTSSAELSEAINSMYKWYETAAKCYVYLNDVEHDVYMEERPTLDDHGGRKGIGSHFGSSQWFTRGWTLQELIAPTALEFYAADWKPLDKRDDIALVISRITRIKVEVLTGAASPRQYSIACRMSWASSRTTTREEDLAYCLMGIFDINMPMLYGEGNKAFIRLQEEILRVSNDHSIFAWTDVGSEVKVPSPCGLLATTPALFKNEGEYVPDSALMRPEARLVTLTNNGISLNARIVAEEGSVKAVLDCYMPPAIFFRPALHLVCVDRQGSQFARVDPSAFDMTDANAPRQQIYVKQDVRTVNWKDTQWRPQMFKIEIVDSDGMKQGNWAYPPTFDCWLSPQSYVVKPSATIKDYLSTTRAKWVPCMPEMLASRNVDVIRAEKHRLLAETFFSLPSFPETPAVIIGSAWGNLLIGRAYDGSVGIQETPLALIEAVNGSRSVVDGMIPIDLQPIADMDTVVHPKLSNGATTGVRVTSTHREECDEFVVEILLAGPPVETFEKKVKDWIDRREFLERSSVSGFGRSGIGGSSSFGSSFSRW